MSVFAYSLQVGCILLFGELSLQTHVCQSNCTMNRKSELKFR